MTYPPDFLTSTSGTRITAQFQNVSLFGAQNYTRHSVTTVSARFQPKIRPSLPAKTLVWGSVWNFVSACFFPLVTQHSFLGCGNKNCRHLKRPRFNSNRKYGQTLQLRLSFSEWWYRIHGWSRLSYCSIRNLRETRFSCNFGEWLVSSQNVIRVVTW